MPPQPFYPTVDPASSLGQRLLARQQPAMPAGLAFGGGDLGGRDTSDPQIQAMLREQNLAALGTPPAGLLAGMPTPASDAKPNAPAPAGPTPNQLVAGDTPLAPVPTENPFRLNDPGFGAVAGAAAVPPGQVIPVDRNDPRSRNPFMYQDGGTWRSDLQGGAMGPAGFTPGFVSSGPGGARAWADSPSDFLMALHQNATANGVNPNVLAQQFLGQLNSSADLAGRAGLAAQQGGVNLATGRMSADAQRDSARTSAEGAARSAAFGAIPGLATAAGTGSMPPALIQSLGDIINSGLMGPAGRPAGAGPGLSGGPAGAAPGGPGTAAPGASPGAALASAAASGEVLRPFQAMFGTRNPATGTVTRPEGFNLGQSVNSLIDRFATANPEQRAALAAAAERGDLGTPEEVLHAIIRQGGVSTLRAHGGVAPGQSGGANMGGMSGLFRAAAGGDSGMAPRPFALAAPGGNPYLTLRADPNQPAAMAALGTLVTGGVPYNQAVVPGFNPVPFSRGDINSLGNRVGTSPEADQTRGVSAMDLIRMTQRYRNATAPR